MIIPHRVAAAFIAASVIATAPAIAATDTSRHSIPPIAEASRTAAVRGAMLGAWQTRDGHTVYVSCRIQITSTMPIAIAASDFAAQVTSADNSALVRTLSPLITAAPTIRSTPLHSQQLVDPAVDLGAMGTVTLQPNVPVTVVVTFISDRPIVGMLGVVYRRAAVE